MKRTLLLLRTLLVASSFAIAACAAEVRLVPQATGPAFQIIGDPDNDWPIQASSDLTGWADVPALGTLLAGEKVPALAGNRILFRDGVPVATVIAGKIDYLAEPGTAREAMHAALVGRAY